MSYQSFVNAMKDLRLDDQTKPTSVYNKDVYNDGQLFSYSKPLKKVELNQTYSLESSLEVFEVTKGDLVADEKVIAVSEAVGDSVIHISSDKDDWIGQGKNDFLSAKHYKIHAAQDVNRLVISAQGEEDIDKWTFEVFLPDKYSIKNTKASGSSGESYYWQGNNEIEVSVLVLCWGAVKEKENVQLKYISEMRKML